MSTGYTVFLHLNLHLNLHQKLLHSLKTLLQS